jgi:hypothetical protein
MTGRRYVYIILLEQPGNRGEMKFSVRGLPLALLLGSPVSAQMMAPPERRVTVLLDSSAPYKPQFSGAKAEEYADYRFQLVSMLSALLERLPGTEVRLVVFDLDRQSESLRRDRFTLADMPKAVHAVDDLEHAVVSVGELQNQPGRWDMLRNLIESEANGQNSADVVIFIGARTATTERIPREFPKFDKRAKTRFVYLRYEFSRYEPNPSPTDPNSLPENHPISLSRVAASVGPIPLPPVPPDPIELVVEREKGKTLSIHAPSEFAKAIEIVAAR